MRENRVYQLVPKRYSRILISQTPDIFRGFLSVIVIDKIGLVCFYEQRKECSFRMRYISTEEL